MDPLTKRLKAVYYASQTLQTAYCMFTFSKLFEKPLTLTRLDHEQKKKTHHTESAGDKAKEGNKLSLMTLDDESNNMFS